MKSSIRTALLSPAELAGVLTLLDGRDWSLGVKSLENCVLAEREVAPQTWTRLLESHA